MPVNVPVKREELFQAWQAGGLHNFGCTDKTYRFYLAWVTKDERKIVDGQFDLLGDLAETGEE